MTIAAGLQAVMLPMLPLHLATSLTPVQPVVSPLVQPVVASTPTPVFGDPCGIRKEAEDQVVAGEDLPLGVLSAEFAPGELLKAENSEDARLQVRLSSGGEIVCDKRKDCTWIAATQLADDVHSCNVLLQASPSQIQRHRLIIRTVRPLRKGQQLLLWFSEELLVPLNLPFLLPANIQAGDKRYVCHICRRQFEAPNPLKIHLALNCGTQSIRHFWRRLLRPASPSPPSPSPPQLLPSTRGAFRPYAANTTRSTTQKSTKSCHESPNPVFFPSHLGFPPFRLPSDGLPMQPFFLHPPVDLTPVTTPVPSPTRHQQPQERSHTLPSISSYHQHATDMETLVSNLGTSKQGHLCIYCGKVYSRKYGLKIHIRTHTGFKPLRCKFCLRPFGDPSNLNKHVRLHAEGKTPYKCTLCGKVLVRRRDLERHVKSRHGGQSLEKDEEEVASDSADIETDELSEIDDIKEEKDKLD